MESDELLESRYKNGRGPLAVMFTPKSQTFIFFSILCVLLKSEALFTFFVYWLRGLQLTSGTIGLPDYNALSHLWLLKPFFSLLIDKMEAPLSQTEREFDVASRTPEASEKELTTDNLFVQYSSLNFFVNITNYRVLLLLAVEYLIAFSSITLYVLHVLNCFHTLFTNVLVYLQGLSLVCASSYAEALFCRYVKSKPRESHVKFVSQRLAMSSLYGFTTLGCLLLPIFFHEGPVGKFFQTTVLFPLFLTFNALFVSWLVSRSVLMDEEGSDLGHGRDMKQERGSESKEYNFRLKLGPDDHEKESETFSVQLLVPLLLLLLVSMRLKNDFYNRHNHTKVDNYLYILLTQFFKFVASLFMFNFMGTKSLKRSSVMVFGTVLLLLYPFKSMTSVFFESLSRLGRWQVLVVGFVLSLVQQLLMTYSLFMCLHLAPKGYEAFILSLPSFVANTTHLCLRQHVMDYLDLSVKQKSIFQYFTFVIFCYFLYELCKDAFKPLKEPGVREATTELPLESPDHPLDDKYIKDEGGDMYYVHLQSKDGIKKESKMKIQ